MPLDEGGWLPELELEDVAAAGGGGVPALDGSGTCGKEPSDG